MSADKRPQLINLSFMVVLLLMISAVFVALVNGRNDFENERFDLPPDGLSEAYMKVFLRAEPDNHPVRLQLAKHYLTIGEWNLARQVLLEGGASLATLPQAQWLMLQVLLDHYSALPGTNPKRQLLKQTVREHIATLDMAQLSTEQVLMLADISLQVGAPDYAATFYVIMAKEDPANAWHWYAEAGRWALAANLPEEAVAYYEQAFRAAPDPDTAAMLVDEASRIREFTNQGGEALAMIQRALNRHPQDLRLLARGISLAIAQQQQQLASEWNRLYLKEKPNDSAALARQIDFELQGGHKESALYFSRQYIRLAPMDDAALARHAELEEWNGRYAEALQTLKILAHRTPDPQIYPRMLRVAQVGYETDIELEILDTIAADANLTENEALRFAARYEYLGYPERADHLLDLFDRRHPQSRAVIVFQAELRERMGDLEQALESRRSLSARRNARSDDHVQYARLLFQMGRIDEAHPLISRKMIIDGTPSDYALQLAGELAWLQGDYDMAATAYRDLWLRKPGDDFSRQRLITASQQLGKTTEVVELLEEHWRRTGNRRALVDALTAARQAQMWPLMDRLFTLTESVSDQFAADENYWLLKGEWHNYREEYPQAYLAYRQALAINSRSAAAADGALWSLINAKDRVRLGPWVDDHVRSGLPLTEAYAIALRLLGRDNEALVWYEARVEQHQNDGLWLLDFADLLANAGRENSAHRVRKHALGVLMVQKESIADDRLVEVVADLQGIPVASRWLATRAHTVEKATVLNWWLYRQHHDAARSWLLEHHIERSRLPAWQQLQLAMREDDHETVAELLQDDAINFAPVDRMNAYTFLGRDDLAFAEIGFLEQLDPEHRAAAVAAAVKLPNMWETGYSIGSIGGLGIHNFEGLYWRNRGAYGWGLVGGISAFEEDADVLAVSPHNETRLTGSWRRYRDDVWAFDLGYRDGNGGSVFPLDLTYRSTDQRRWQYQLGLQSNSLTAVSGLMRLLGVQDRLGVAFEYSIDPRLSLSIGANRHRYESLGGSTLAHGNTINFNFSYRLFGGSTQWLLGGGVAWEKNNVVDQVPDDLQLFLNPDVGTDALVPEEYRDIGLSMYLGRGQLLSTYPMEVSPQSASPRWFTDLWLGYIEPEATLGVAARVGVGTSVFGGDELGLTAAYDDRLNKIAGGGPSYRVQLYYRFYLGR